jgi:hypothetical protein
LDVERWVFDVSSRMNIRENAALLIVAHGSTLKSGLARANFLVAINLSTVRPSGFTKNTGWDDLQLR